jgi:hypothetical protein
MKYSLKGICLKSVEFRLSLGQPIEAVAELQKLRRQACKATWAVAVFRCAARQFGGVRRVAD